MYLDRNPFTIIPSINQRPGCIDVIFFVVLVYQKLYQEKNTYQGSNSVCLKSWWSIDCPFPLGIQKRAIDTTQLLHYHLSNNTGYKISAIINNLSNLILVKVIGELHEILCKYIHPEGFGWGSLNVHWWFGALGSHVYVFYN